MHNIPDNINIFGEITEEFSEILTPEALRFLAQLHRHFESARQRLLEKRSERYIRLDQGEKPDFLAETQHIRESEWIIQPVPNALQCRRVEITGPVDALMMIKALNCGADVFMADFEDALTPTWNRLLQGQINIKKAVRRTLEAYHPVKKKEYRLYDNIATLMIRPRGWHLNEKHIVIDGQPVSASIFDFALCFFHNAQEQIARGAGPFFYLPKIESHLEARLWNDIFCMSQDLLGIPRGSVKATVLIETVLAAFEMDEILYELKEHSAGLNAGRWDYLFSCIKKFRTDHNFCLADRGLLTMSIPFMRAYSLLLIKTCHKREATAIGSMSALIPIKNNPEQTQVIFNKIRDAKRIDALDGYDGGWVAHLKLVPLAMSEFDHVLNGRNNQIENKKLDVAVNATDLLNFQPQQPITEQGLRLNVNVTMHYIASWLSGHAAVNIHGVMEDAATAEISRSQLWHWIRSPLGLLDDGRKITVQLIRDLIKEELLNIKAIESINQWADKAAFFLDKLIVSDIFEEFLTLSLYEELR
jgi:malate synthase